MHAKINVIEGASDKVISEKTIVPARIIDISNNT